MVRLLLNDVRVDPMCDDRACLCMAVEQRQHKVMKVLMNGTSEGIVTIVDKRIVARALKVCKERCGNCCYCILQKWKHSVNVKHTAEIGR